MQIGMFIPPLQIQQDPSPNTRTIQDDGNLDVCLYSLRPWLV